MGLELTLKTNHDMKKIFAILAAFAALTSCSVKELTGPESSADSPILHASFEDGADATKTYVDGGLHLFWTADDRLSVFLGTTYNQQYRFTGETGDNTASVVLTHDMFMKFLSIWGGEYEWLEI